MLAAAPSLLPALEFRVASVDPSEEQYRVQAGAGKSSTTRGAPGRTRAVARLVGCQWLFLDVYILVGHAFRTQCEGREWRHREAAGGGVDLGTRYCYLGMM